MHQLIALAPAVIFLTVLWFMDSFRLVRPAAIALALLYGAIAALGCEALHGWLVPALGLESQTFSRYVAPFTEEIAKAGLIGLLISRGRVASSSMRPCRDLRSAPASRSWRTPRICATSAMRR